MLPDLDQLNGWLSTREAAEGNIREGCAKEVIWADGAVRRKHVLVYIHGFSATKGELRPLPDLVAKALGANLFYTRLTGHGQDGAAMGRARLTDWEADVDQALAIAKALGDEVILMGCSTGCTLITTALARGAGAKGVVHVAPNYGLHNRFVQALVDAPGVRHWGPWVAGRERSFEPLSDAHARLWTIKYDTQAVFTMAEAVRAARASAIEGIETPAYFAFADADQVVSAKRSRAVMARWGGPVTQDLLTVGPADDQMGHVMAGDVFSPQQTAPLAARIIDWAKGL